LNVSVPERPGEQQVKPPFQHHARTPAVEAENEVEVPIGASAEVWASRPQKLAGGMAALAIGAVVYSQLNLYSRLTRDDAIYLYGGQRVTHGVPPYASIMDPKGPIPGILDGFGVVAARLFGHSDLLVVRVEYCALAVLSVLAIYLLVMDLWHSVTAGVVAATIFTSFEWYAGHALTGPQGHMPGIAFLIFAMWLVLRRKWYWSGFSAMLAFLSWQPLFAYPVIVVLCAMAWPPGRRLRTVCHSLAGVATPFGALAVYYAAEGYLGRLFEGLFIFPLTAVHRGQRRFGERAHFIVQDIWASYGSSAILLYIGLALFLIEVIRTLASNRSEWRTSVISPIILLVFTSFILQFAYFFYDYIGPTHAFPLLPYSAVGFGAVAAHLMHRLSGRRARQIAVACVLAAVVATTTVYAALDYQASDDTSLLGQRASSCAVQRSLAPRSTLWVIDNPIPLVLLHRTNPDNYAYVGSGLADWRVNHTAGGLAGWMHQIKASASIVVLQDWSEHIPVHAQITNWLRTHGYHHGFIGQWAVHVTRAARARMAAQSIALSRKSNLWPLTTTGADLHATGCTTVIAG
jgi:hypothetical protein